MRLNHRNTYHVKLPGMEEPLYVALNQNKSCAYRVSEPPPGYAPDPLPPTSETVLAVGIEGLDGLNYCDIVSS